MNCLYLMNKLYLKHLWHKINIDMYYDIWRLFLDIVDCETTTVCTSVEQTSTGQRQRQRQSRRESLRGKSVINTTKYTPKSTTGSTSPLTSSAGPQYQSKQSNIRICQVLVLLLDLYVLINLNEEKNFSNLMYILNCILNLPCQISLFKCCMIFY